MLAAIAIGALSFSAPTSQVSRRDMLLGVAGVAPLFAPLAANAGIAIGSQADIVEAKRMRTAEIAVDNKVASDSNSRRHTSIPGACRHHPCEFDSHH